MLPLSRSGDLLEVPGEVPEHPSTAVDLSRKEPSQADTKTVSRTATPGCQSRPQPAPITREEPQLLVVDLGKAGAPQQDGFGYAVESPAGFGRGAECQSPQGLSRRGRPSAALQRAPYRFSHKQKIPITDVREARNVATRGGPQDQ
jgi:hypothetical protein